MNSTSKLFTEAQKKQIVTAIQEAELNTSGEIRVHIEQSCEGDVMERAQKVFGELKMHQTKDRNGVLFYLAVETRKFAVFGDAGIHKVVGNEFWDSIKDITISYFKKGDFSTGLSLAIEECGIQLKAYFPYEKGKDTNELSDDISFQ